MKMDVFAAKVCAAVQRELGEGYVVENHKVRKNNGVVLTGLMIRKQDHNVFPAIYLDEFFESYQSGAPFNALVREMIAVYRRHAPGGLMDMDFFRSFEKVKDRICYRLIRREGNGDLLKDIPHADFLDLAVCFCYVGDWEGLADGSILIYNSHADTWGTDADELYRLAEKNTPRIFPWFCRAVGEVLADVLGDNGAADGNAFSDGAPLKVLTNAKQTHGAACILYPGVLEEMARREKNNFYVIPSSIHETLLADTGDAGLAEKIRGMIAEVNRTQVAPEEVLSDTLYYYDMSEKQLKIV